MSWGADQSPRNMSPLPKNPFAPDNALGIDFSSEIIIVDSPPLMVHRSLKPAIVETYNPFQTYNDGLDTRPVTSAAIISNRPPTPLVESLSESDKPLPIVSHEDAALSPIDELMPLVRTRGQLRAILQENRSPSGKRNLETCTPPRKRRATPINIEAATSIEHETDNHNSDSDSLSEIDTVSEPDPRQLDSSDNEVNALDIASIDPRYDSRLVQFRDGAYWVPNRCRRYFSSNIRTKNSCCQRRSFCDRSDPCSRCSNVGVACIREEGLSKVRSSSYRVKDTQIPTKTIPKSIVKKPVQRRTIIRAEEQPLPPKPAARGEPLVWTDTRQELCEGVPYFRSYQGGIYFRHEVAFGYLLDAFGAERDFIGSHVVISHGQLLFEMESDL